MSNKILIGDYQVDLLKRRVYIKDVEVSIRPKSFELLNLLLSSPKEVVSKETILGTIWDDVSVDEQVIFQSIKELRKAFSELDAIKTFPRKGYAWVAEISYINEVKSSENPKTEVINLPNQTTTVSSKKNLILPIISLISFCLLFFLFFKFWLADNKENVREKIDGSIIVMPIKEHLNDRDHKWVKIGGMDLLIQQIPSSKNYGVMQVDDVLEIMKRAEIPLTDVDPTHADRIFQVSGAELIIETELSGSPGDYQLVYTLRRKQSIDRGVLITSEIYDAIDQLANLVASRLGATTSSLHISRNKLSNQLLAQSFDAKNSGEFVEAEQYLKSVLAIEPNNMQAKRMLAEISVYLKKTEQISEIVSSVDQQHIDIDSAQQAYRQREYGRLLFWQGLNELQFGRIQNGKNIFDEATSIVTAAQDWLYLGYLAEGQGHLHRSIKEYEVASQYYNAAIKNHQIIKCPFGEGNNLLNLAENSFLQTNYIGALSQVNKAITLAKRRELNSLLEKAKLAEKKYSTRNHQ